MIEAHRIDHLQPLGRHDPEAPGPNLDRDGLADLQEGLRSELAPEAGVTQQLNEGERAAVHDGNFGSVQVDLNVVHAHPRQGGHDVLDRLDRGPVLGDRGRVMGICDIFGAGRDRGRTGQIHPPEDHPAIGCRGA